MSYYEVRSKALEEIQSHKTLCERVADNNLLNALKYDEIKSLYNEIKDAKRELAKGDKTSKELETLNKYLIDNRNRLIKVLTKYKINISSFVPQYWCKECKDLGSINGQVCQCVKAKTTTLLMSVDGMQPVEKTFDNVKFDLFDNPEYMQNIYAKAKTFIDKMDTTKYNNFTILGGVGVGKTHLMECMTNYALNKHKYVIYLSAFKLNQIFLNYHTCAILEKNNIIEPLLSCDLLCIDDLGCEQLLNNVTIPMLTMLINERNLASKKTVITSNLMLDDIRERYDYRLCSRLLDNSVSLTIMIQGTDLRQKK